MGETNRATDRARIRLGPNRLEAPPDRAGEQAEDQRWDDGQESVEEHRGDDLRVGAAETDQRGSQSDFDDAESAWRDRQRAEQPNERPGGEGLGNGTLIAIDGLWAIAFGNGSAAGPTTSL